MHALGLASPRSSPAIRCHGPGSFTAMSPETKLPREEPYAGNLHVRVCEGRGWQHPRLLGRFEASLHRCVAAGT
jgi:hypothetical protein